MRSCINGFRASDSIIEPLARHGVARGSSLRSAVSIVLPEGASAPERRVGDAPEAPFGRLPSLATFVVLRCAF